MEDTTKNNYTDTYNEKIFNKETLENPKTFPKTKSKICWHKIIFGAFSIAILFLPSHYLITALSLKTSGVAFAVILLCGAMSFFAVLSESVGQAGLKWLISLPITLVFWVYLVETQFSLRILNWTVRDYGKSNAGDSMFFMFMLLTHLGAVGCALGTGLVISGLSKYIKSEKTLNAVSIIKKACEVAVVVIAAAILLLDMAMPMYRTVYG